VLAALRQGLVIGPDRGPFGGLPGCLRPDRGLEFAAAALRQAAFALGVTLLPAPPYAPHLKGKVERFGGTLAGELRVLPPAASTVATRPRSPLRGWPPSWPIWSPPTTPVLIRAWAA
jgi:transposase InsO family protein